MVKRTCLASDGCPVARSLDAIGDWWSLLIVRDALLGRRRFGEFQKSLGLAKNILTVRLRALVDRGILETIYFRAVNAGSAEDLLRVYESRYADEPFVRLYRAGRVPDLHGVAHTNFCDIGVHLDAATGRAVVVSAIDNLVKGAAGQAVQALNAAMGWDEALGLDLLGG